MKLTTPFLQRSQEEDRHSDQCPPASANNTQTYGEAADWSNTGVFICYYRADTVHEPQVYKIKTLCGKIQRSSLDTLPFVRCKRLCNQFSTDNGSRIVTHHRFCIQCGINCCYVHLTSISVTDENLKSSACERARGDLVPQVTDNEVTLHQFKLNGTRQDGHRVNVVTNN